VKGKKGKEGEGSTDWAGEVGSGLSWAVQLSLALLKRGRKNIFNSLDYCHGSSFLRESFPPSFFRASPFDGVDVWVLNAKLRDATGLPLGIYGYGVEAWSYSDFWVCEDTQLFFC